MPIDPVTGIYKDEPTMIPQGVMGSAMAVSNAAIAGDLSRQENERRQLEQLFRELALQKGSYDFGRQQETDRGWDELTGISDPDELMTRGAILSQSTAGLGSRQNALDRTALQQKREFIRQQQEAVRSGAKDPQVARGETLARYPDDPFLAEQVGSLRVDRKIESSSSLSDARTDEITDPNSGRNRKTEVQIRAIKEAINIRRRLTELKESGGLKGNAQEVQFQVRRLDSLKRERRRAAANFEDTSDLDAEISEIDRIVRDLATGQQATGAAPPAGDLPPGFNEGDEIYIYRPSTQGQ